MLEEWRKIADFYLHGSTSATAANEQDQHGSWKLRLSLAFGLLGPLLELSELHLQVRVGSKLESGSGVRV